MKLPNTFELFKFFPLEKTQKVHKKCLCRKELFRKKFTKNVGVINCAVMFGILYI